MPSHLHDELAANSTRVTVETAFGPVTGGRASNGAAVFLGMGFVLSCDLWLISDVYIHRNPIRHPTRAILRPAAAARGLPLRGTRVHSGEQVYAHISLHTLTASDEWKDAAQPTNDGQAAGSPFEDKVGYGQPTENPYVIVFHSFPPLIERLLVYF
jgi:hypothetical protein